MFPERWQYHKRYGDDLHPWDLGELQNAFKVLLAEDRRSIKLCFFIDGLDEFSGDHVDLVAMIHEFVRTSTAKFCISSRPWVCFEDAFSHRPHLLLETITYPDIVAYVTSRFRENQRYLRLEEAEPEYTKQLVNEVCIKASGVFLWVLLVVRSLVDGITNADRISDLQRRLGALPADLEDLFSKMLGQVNPFYYEHASKLFQLVRAAYEPLSLLQMSFADEEDPDLVIRAEVKPLNKEQIRRREEDMNRRLKSRCMGLLEIPAFDDARDVSDGSLSSPLPARSAPLTYEIDSSRTVQYLHRTVKDYIEQPLVWERIVSMNPQAYHPSLALLRSYLLRLKTFTRKDFHLCTENVILAMFYARQAEIETGGASVTLLDELDKTLNVVCARDGGLLMGTDWESSQSWTSVCGCVPLELQQGSNFLSLAVMADLRLYVKEKIDGVSSRLSDGEGCPLLIYALAECPRQIANRPWPPVDIVRMLLDEDADPDDRFNGRTVLSYALAAAKPSTEDSTTLSTKRKWLEIVDLILLANTGPSREDFQGLIKFMRKCDPIRAARYEQSSKRKGQRSDLHCDPDNTPPTSRSSIECPSSRIKEAAPEQNQEPQANAGFWNRIGQLLFGP